MTSILGRLKDAPTHLLDALAILAGDAPTLDGLRAWLMAQRATAPETHG